jgi:hypothetical protein
MTIMQLVRSKGKPHVSDGSPAAAASAKLIDAGRDNYEWCPRSPRELPSPDLRCVSDGSLTAATLAGLIDAGFDNYRWCPWNSVNFRGCDS